ncbi:DUF5605 domain-containing protein [Leifsonia aquatica]|uniref:DUF5605 domain-containing protein n=1 Tax=Leifsonia aquatica TaxID=144185 RepID=UPI000B24689F|nr:DUF5605 domain-containing protein [Leifsonia aquatica]
MPSSAPHFSGETTLIEFTSSPAAIVTLGMQLPNLLSSPMAAAMLHKPLRVVLATEPDLSDEDRDRIIASIEGFGPDEGAESSRPAPSPAIYRNDYETDDVPRGSAATTAVSFVEVWGRFEIEFSGPSHGNPYLDVELIGTFRRGHHSAEALGFYDGDGRFLLRFMPPTPGEWTFETRSNARSLDGIVGSFTVGESLRRGPVRVADRFHFRYADGSQYLAVGTTAYAWTHQPEELQQETLRTLAESPFTKVRMCVFPKSYVYNHNDPDSFPFASDDEGIDFSRFDPAYWSHLEKRIDDLAALGIEADLILFHSYDRWGFSALDAEIDDRYVRYVAARLSSFANVWWSLANEYDFVLAKSADDWRRWAGILRRWDPSDHLISIHNGLRFYDYSESWATHASVQRTDNYKSTELVTEWRAQWGKPVVVDEAVYEGDIDLGWGNITGEELTRRFWEAFIRGGYATHGETYYQDDEVLFWAKGGVLRGTSPARIGFLAKLVQESPRGFWEPLTQDFDAQSAGIEGEYLITYYGLSQPRFRHFVHDPAFTWRADVIDTWNMTVETLPGTYSGRFTINLPGRPYMAIRLRRA